MYCACQEQNQNNDVSLRFNQNWTIYKSPYDIVVTVDQKRVKLTAEFLGNARTAHLYTNIYNKLHML